MNLEKVKQTSLIPVGERKEIHIYSNPLPTTLAWHQATGWKHLKELRQYYPGAYENIKRQIPYHIRLKVEQEQETAEA